MTLIVFGLLSPSLVAQTYDLLIKEGHLIDPGNRIDRVMDLAVSGTRIARVAPDIPAGQAKKIIDARGLYVTPGLIDLHAHVFGYSGSLWPDDTHFLWPAATKAMEQGFPPDTISTDLHNASIFSTKSDMPNCISKMINLGMDLEEAIRRSTVRPAEIVKHYPELGTLGEGKVADIAVFELRTGVFAFSDSWKKKLMGNKLLQAVLTIRGGELVFDQNGLGFPEWQNAGEYEVIP